MIDVSIGRGAMNLDSTNFTPWAALAGGVLIGTAVALLLLLNGRIAGISGIVGGLLRHVRGDVAWRWAFLAGLLAAPFAAALVRPVPLPHISAAPGVLVFAGLLVGLGTRIGSGCTSGHGVCGLARGSARSIAATATFMTVAVGVVFALRHIIGPW